MPPPAGPHDTRGNLAPSKQSGASHRQLCAPSCGRRPLLGRPRMGTLPVWGPFSVTLTSDPDRAPYTSTRLPCSGFAGSLGGRGLRPGHSLVPVTGGTDAGRDPPVSQDGALLLWALGLPRFLRLLPQKCVCGVTTAGNGGEGEVDPGLSQCSASKPLTLRKRGVAGHPTPVNDFLTAHALCLRTPEPPPRDDEIGLGGRETQTSMPLTESI